MELPPINPVDFKRRYETPPMVPEETTSDPPSKIAHSIYHDRHFEPWDLSDLESFFQNTKLPDHPIRLNPWSLITHPALFVSSHLEFVRHNNGNPTFRPYLDRLIEFKIILSKNINNFTSYG